MEFDMKPSPTVTAKHSNRLRPSLGRDLEFHLTLPIPQSPQYLLREWFRLSGLLVMSYGRGREMGDSGKRLRRKVSTRDRV